MKKSKWYLLIILVVGISLWSSSICLIQLHQILSEEKEESVHTLFNITIGNTLLSIDLSSPEDATFELLEA